MADVRTGVAAGAEGPTQDPRAGLRSARAAPGGLDEPVRFTDRQVQILKAAGDELIPPGRGFPAPSEVGVVEDFLGRYITPSGAPPAHFPFAGEDDFKASLDALGDGFLAADAAGRVATLKEVERRSPDFFSQLRSLFYYGYYSRPQVVQAIRAQLAAGQDYHGPPQPYGYLSGLERWGDGQPPAGRGSYIRTADVRRAAIGEEGPR